RSRAPLRLLRRDADPHPGQQLPYRGNNRGRVAFPFHDVGQLVNQQLPVGGQLLADRPPNRTVVTTVQPCQDRGLAGGQLIHLGVVATRPSVGILHPRTRPVSIVTNARILVFDASLRRNPVTPQLLRTHFALLGQQLHQMVHREVVARVGVIGATPRQPHVVVGDDTGQPPGLHLRDGQPARGDPVGGHVPPYLPHQQRPRDTVQPSLARPRREPGDLVGDRVIVADLRPGVERAQVRIQR